MRDPWISEEGALRERMSDPAQATAMDPEARLPAYATAFLAHLRLLVGVPFEYLVPDTAMLADESIRFFHLDRSWTDRVVDGVLGRARATNESGRIVRTRPFRQVHLELRWLRVYGEAEHTLAYQHSYLAVHRQSAYAAQHIFRAVWVQAFSGPPRPYRARSRGCRAWRAATAPVPCAGTARY